MVQIKPLSKQAIAGALQKAEQYRLLNEPENAESICQDVLAVEPDNQAALIALVLALTDQFPEGLHGRFDKANETASRLQNEYERIYYSGIICERRAKAHHRRGTPACGQLAYDWLNKAMELYERAEKLRPTGNDEALLRWNTCARIIARHPKIQPMDDTSAPLQLE